jgi:hypothetical protein
VSVEQRRWWRGAEEENGGLLLLLRAFIDARGGGRRWRKPWAGNSDSGVVQTPGARSKECHSYSAADRGAPHSLIFI